MSKKSNKRAQGRDRITLKRLYLIKRYGGKFLTNKTRRLSKKQHPP